MHRCGMFIGSHGYDHFWLNTLNRGKQESEIDRSLAFLSNIGISRQNWVMCYPYGAYNDSLMSVLKTKGCRIGLATEVAIADLNTDLLLALPRLDTNDLPKTGSAMLNEWTMQVINGAPVESFE